MPSISLSSLFGGMPSAPQPTTQEKKKSLSEVAEMMDNLGVDSSLLIMALSDDLGMSQEQRVEYAIKLYDEIKVFISLLLPFKRKKKNKNIFLIFLVILVS